MLKAEKAAFANPSKEKRFSEKSGSLREASLSAKLNSYMKFSF